MKYWMEEEDTVVKRYYCSHGVKKIMELLPHRSRDAIQLRASMLGLRIRKKYKRELWTEEETSLLKERYPIMPSKEVVSLFPNRSWSKIKNKVRLLGLKKRVAHWYWNLEPINLSDVDKGYIAGFLDSDGWISLRVHKPNRLDTPEIGFANTITESIRHIKQVLEKANIKVNYYVQQKTRPRLPLHTLKIYNYGDIYRLLTYLRGCLRNRKKKAGEVLEFLKRRARLQEP